MIVTTLLLLAALISTNISVVCIKREEYISALFWACSAIFHVVVMM